MGIVLQSFEKLGFIINLLRRHIVLVGRVELLRWYFRSTSALYFAGLVFRIGASLDYDHEFFRKR